MRYSATTTNSVAVREKKSIIIGLVQERSVKLPAILVCQNMTRQLCSSYTLNAILLMLYSVSEQQLSETEFNSVLHLENGQSFTNLFIVN